MVGSNAVGKYTGCGESEVCWSCFKRFRRDLTSVEGDEGLLCSVGGLSLSCPIFVTEKSCCTFGEREVEGSDGGPLLV